LEKQYLKDLQNPKNQLDANDRTKDLKRKIKKLTDEYCIYPVSNDVLSGTVTHVISPGKFFFRPSPAQNYYEKFQKHIENFVMPVSDCENYETECIGKLLILVKHCEEYRRCQIINTYKNENDENILQIKLIDYGSTGECKTEDLFTLQEVTLEKRHDLLRSIFEFSPMQFECSIAGKKFFNFSVKRE
jgi:Tudor domain